jgi:hypothetical protein
MTETAGYFGMTETDTSTFPLLFLKKIILNPLMKVAHIRPNDAQ